MPRTTQIQRIKDGFQNLPLPDPQKEQALKNLEQWLTHDEFSIYWPQLEAMIDNGAWSGLFDSFYRILPFGTGGRRGAVGIGTNRINATTISTSVQGHATYLKECFPDTTDLSVVIAYDVRQFHDLRKTYDPNIENPLLGLTSKDLGQLAAEVYAANGIRSYLLDPSLETYISTPELSFLIRHFGAHGGLNVSASHNHPDDNGGKFYNEDGGQPVPPDDQKMSEHVEKVTRVDQMPFEKAHQEGWVQWIKREHRDAYIDVNLHRQLRTHPDKAIVAFTPMHGTGSTSVGRLLERAGYTVHTLASQANFDGTFENVRYRIPNPEVPSSMSDAIELGKEVGADLVLATDPDADRIGLAAPNPQGEWTCFTGNEIAALVTHYMLESLKENGTLPTCPLVVKTEVTSDLIRRITESFGGVCVGDLLVGFKYIGEALKSWETTGQFLGVPGSTSDFVLGTEESHGFLTTPDFRDKDAAGAALYLAELASKLKTQGRTFHEALDDLYQQYGYFSNRLTSMVMEGAVGISNIRQILTSLRANPPQEIAGYKITAFFDHQDPNGRFGPIRSETDLSSRNVLVFHMEDGVRLILRPSGTEPKAKLYIEAPSAPLSSQEELKNIIPKIDNITEELGKNFARDALKLIGIDLPPYALRISDLISIDNKLHFAQTIIPEWSRRTDQLPTQPSDQQLQSISEWLQQALSPFGGQPRGLIEQSVEAYLAQLDNPTHIAHMRATFEKIQ